jgi:hypothetical protein
VQSASRRSSSPRQRINDASRSANDRRPSYLKAWMISRNAPVYSPTARDRSMIRLRSLHRLHTRGEDSMARASGSPHASQRGGVMGRMAAQQFLHTGPSRGSSKIALHAAHCGASNTDSKPFTAWPTSAVLSRQTSRFLYELILVMRRDRASRVPADRIPTP